MLLLHNGFQKKKYRTKNVPVILNYKRQYNLINHLIVLTWSYMVHDVHEILTSKFVQQNLVIFKLLIIPIIY